MTDIELLLLEWAIHCKIYSPRHFVEDKSLTDVRRRVVRSMSAFMGHKQYVAAMMWLDAVKKIDKETERR